MYKVKINLIDEISKNKDNLRNLCESMSSVQKESSLNDLKNDPIPSQIQPNLNINVEIPENCESMEFENESESIERAGQSVENENQPFCKNTLALDKVEKDESVHSTN